MRLARIRRCRSRPNRIERFPSSALARIDLRLFPCALHWRRLPLVCAFCALPSSPSEQITRAMLVRELLQWAGETRAESGRDMTRGPGSDENNPPGMSQRRGRNVGPLGSHCNNWRWRQRNSTQKTAASSTDRPTDRPTDRTKRTRLHAFSLTGTFDRSSSLSPPSALRPLRRSPSRPYASGRDYLAISLATDGEGAVSLASVLFASSPRSGGASRQQCAHRVRVRAREISRVCS